MSELEHALRRLLHSCESGYRLGAEKADVIVSRLNEMGFEIEDQLLTSEQVDSAFTSEDGAITQWYYLIPEDELSEEYEEMIEEFDETTRKKMDYANEFEDE